MSGRTTAGASAPAAATPAATRYEVRVSRRTETLRTVEVEAHSHPDAGRKAAAALGLRPAQWMERESPYRLDVFIAEEGQ